VDRRLAFATARGTAVDNTRHVDAGSDLMMEYEYQVLTFARDQSRPAVRRVLAEQAEYGHWELYRVRLYWGGVRRAWLRRKIIRVRRTA
jgi:hypothetical protein